MRVLSTSILLLMLSVGHSVANELLPVDFFAKHAQYHQVEISPDGKNIAVTITNNLGDRTVAILELGSNKVLNTLSWSGNELPNSVQWLNNERIAIEVGYKIGAIEQPMLTGEYVAMNIDGSRKVILHGMRKEGKRNQAKSKADNGKMYITNTLDADPKTIQILTVPFQEGFAEMKTIDVYTGRERLIAKSPVKGGALLSDRTGEVRFASGLESIDGVNFTTLYYRDSNKDEWMLFGKYDEDVGSVTPVAFSEDGKSVYVMTDMASKTKGLYSLNLSDKKMQPIAQNERVDIAQMDIDQNSNLYAVHFEPDYSELKIVDNQHKIGKWYSSLAEAFSGSRIRITSATMDGSKLIVKVSSDKDSGSFYLFNAKQHNVQLLMKAKPWISDEQLAQTKAIEFKARDGVSIFGYLTLPTGKSESLPMIVIPHGGPHGPRDTWSYDDDVQFLASRGYAVLQVNFRGSGGYGKEFQRMGYRKWGSDIMNDITDGVYWAVKQGIADVDRLCIFGASFGGYASLMSVVKEPDLYKCALGYVGVYDMELLFETGDIPESQYGTNFLDRVIGQDEAEKIAFSPARHVEKIKADLFIVHGKEDKRAHFDHALLLQKNLEEKGIKHEILFKEKEGHGFYNEENRKELYEKMQVFFAKNLSKQ